MKHEREQAEPRQSAPRSPRTVVLADDHAFTLQGMCAALASRADLEIVGTAANGIEAIALVKRHRPDLAMFDYAMPNATGHEAFVEARRWSPDTRFVIVTGAASPQRFSELVALGIDGIFLKTMDADGVCDGVDRVLNGERVLAGIARDNTERPTLTGRERQVLEGIARGLSGTRIASDLGVSAKTVESHRATLMRKLAATNTASMMMNAMRAGLISP